MHLKTHFTNGFTQIVMEIMEKQPLYPPDTLGTMSLRDAASGAGEFPLDQPPGVIFLFPFWIPEKLHHLLQQMLLETSGLATAFGHRFWECPGRVRKRCTFSAKRQKNSPSR